MSRVDDSGQFLLEETRQAIRYACVLDATAEDGQRTRFRSRWPVRVVDISATGVGLHSGELFAIGTILTIRLHGPTQKLPPLQVRVVRCTEQDNATWILGAAFLAPLTDADLNKLRS